MLYPQLEQLIASSSSENIPLAGKWVWPQRALSKERGCDLFKSSHSVMAGVAPDEKG